MTSRTCGECRWMEAGRCENGEIASYRCTASITDGGSAYVATTTDATGCEPFERRGEER